MTKAMEEGEQRKHRGTWQGSAEQVTDIKGPFSTHPNENSQLIECQPSNGERKKEINQLKRKNYRVL